MKLQVLCGMIASGKSTYCKNAVRQGYLCVSDDAIVNMLHADQYPLYSNDLKLLYKSIENYAVSAGLMIGKTVMIDRGVNISLKGRKRWLALASSFEVPCEAIVFKNEGPEIHAFRRADSDPRGYSIEYWTTVAQKHHSLYIEPTISEGFDAVHHVSFEEIIQGKYIEGL